MTFFANSGVTWPNIEHETREAGAKSLDAASRIWKILAALEDRENHSPKQEDLVSCAYSLQSASDIYSKIADQLKHETVEGITPAELDLAALNVPPRYIYRDMPFYKLFLNDSSISVGRLYRCLLYTSDAADE